MEKHKPHVVKITIARVFFYQMLMLFVGISIGLIMEPEYWGRRANLFSTFYEHAFEPIKYTNEIEEILIGIGRRRVHITKHSPQHSVIILDDCIENEEWYCAKLKIIDNNGNESFESFRDRIRWRPWEHHYMTEEVQQEFNWADPLLYGG